MEKVRTSGTMDLQLLTPVVRMPRITVLLALLRDLTNSMPFDLVLLLDESFVFVLHFCDI